MSTRVLIALSLVATAAVAFAGPAGTPKGAPAQAAQSNSAPTAGGKEKLVATYDAVGNGSGTSLPQFGFTTVASSTVKCESGGCSIGIESMAQITPKGGDWAICLLVDGTSVSCQYQGVQGSTSGFVVGNARGWASGLSAGNHTVDTQLYAEGAGATYAYFQTDSRVYKP
jgi:hypothetical protein